MQMQQSDPGIEANIAALLEMIKRNVDDDAKGANRV